MSKIIEAIEAAAEAAKCEHQFEYVRDFPYGNGVVGTCTRCRCRFTAFPGTALGCPVSAVDFGLRFALPLAGYDSHIRSPAAHQIGDLAGGPRAVIESEDFGGFGHLGEGLIQFRRG